MRGLFDINLLLALFDIEHKDHARAQEWRYLNREHGWASCPLTQNGYLRIVSQSGYLNPVSLVKALDTLSRAAADERHRFWPDDLSLLNPALVDQEQVRGPNQLTDIYLLARAVRNGGRLVTFDRSIPLAAIRGATADHLVVLR